LHTLDFRRDYSPTTSSKPKLMRAPFRCLIVSHVLPGWLCTLHKLLLHKRSSFRSAQGHSGETGSGFGPGTDSSAQFSGLITNDPFELVSKALMGSSAERGTILDH